MTSKPALNVLTRLPAQVHISANPPPRTLAESKQIFTALQGFGEIISFRNLKVCDSLQHPLPITTWKSD